MSPTASRSVASSHSYDQDPFSPYSKDSVASSGDEDVDLLHSVLLSRSEQSAPRNLGAHPSNNAMSFSRKPTKKLLSSAPKRSFDMVRQMVGTFLILVLSIISLYTETFYVLCVLSLSHALVCML